MQPILVTGGAGFIGGEFVRQWIAHEPSAVINLDKLTYAGNIDSLAEVATNPRHIFIEGDFGDSARVQSLLQEHRPRGIINFAAESHVDRSIDGPAAFVETNVVGTFRLLEEVRQFWKALPVSEQQAFRFLHVSTDEVYGSLGTTGKFLETTPYAPNSPYSASKAASDHFVRAYHHTYGLPTLTTNCSNNYGPYQFPEKLIPLMILNCLEGKALPVYGDGGQIRDWLYVADHCRAIRAVFANGRVGEVYNIGGDCERTNLEVVHAICHAVDRCCPDLPHGPCESLITSVKDRPGHDRRYAIDFQKINQELGWSPLETFSTGIERTVNWYLANQEWMDRLKKRGFDNERLGLESVRSFPALSKSVCSATSGAPHAGEQVLIVGGMHRSGTSLLASLCEGAGVSMGDRLLGVGGGGNPKGHYEDCDFLEFHQQALLANGLNPAGYTTQDTIHVPEAMLDRAQSLIASRSGPDRLWGWKDPRTVLFLDFWHTLLPNAKYLFVFRSPWEVIESFFRRGDGEFICNPSLAVSVWLHYNRLIVDFVKRHPSQCVLKELSQAVDDPASVFQEMRDRLHVPISPPPDRYEEGLLHRTGFAWRSTIVREYAPDAYNLYLEMQNMTGSRATLPDVAAAATGQSLTHSNSLIFEQWSQTSRTEMRAQQLESREKKLTAQLVDAEQQRESLAERLKQVAASHEQSLAAFGRLSNQLDILAHQVAISSSEMAQMAGIVGPTAALPPASVWLHDSDAMHTMHPLLGIVEAKASALSLQLQVSEDLIGQLKKQAAKGSKTFVKRMEQESRRLYGQIRTVLKKVEREILRAKRKASALIT